MGFGFGLLVVLSWLLCLFMVVVSVCGWFAVWLVVVSVLNWLRVRWAWGWVYCFRLCMIASGGLLIVLVNCYGLYFTLLGLVYYLIYLVSLLLVDLRYLLCVGVFIVEL